MALLEKLRGTDSPSKITLTKMRRSIMESVRSIMNEWKSDIFNAVIASFDVQAVIQKMTPIKGVHYFDGAPGKDADEKAIEKRVREKLNNDMPKQSTIESNILSVVETRIAPLEMFMDEKMSTDPETLELSVGDIQGLSQELQLLREAINRSGSGGAKRGGAGGGGMGAVVAESFDVSSATTSITLSSGVASGGNALWLNYQGQQQARGVHFTSTGSKTIPLLFTPDDDTVIDVIYVRK